MYLCICIIYSSAELLQVKIWSPGKMYILSPRNSGKNHRTISLSLCLFPGKKVSQVAQLHHQAKRQTADSMNETVCAKLPPNSGKSGSPLTLLSFNHHSMFHWLISIHIPFFYISAQLIRTARFIQRKIIKKICLCCIIPLISIQLTINLLSLYTKSLIYICLLT